MDENYSISVTFTSDKICKTPEESARTSYHTFKLITTRLALKNVTITRTLDTYANSIFIKIRSTISNNFQMSKGNSSTPLCLEFVCLVEEMSR